MPVTHDRSAPYAPVGIILDLVRRFRDKGLPTPITADVLTRAGVTDSLNSRVLQALEVLDLIDDNGKPTPVFEGIRIAPEAEYKTRLGEWLRAAYADALSFIDPATATETEVRDAFRSYKPHGQQDRMVTLFLGLFEAAGLAPERKRKTAAKTSVASNGSRTPRQPRPEPPSDPTLIETPVRSHQPSTRHAVSDVPAALGGLLASLPSPGDTWTQTDRDRFVRTFEAVLDFCFPVTTGTQKPVS